MMIAPSLLLLTVAAVLVKCRPQDNFSFPGSASRPARFPQQPQTSTRIPPTGFRPQMPSQPFSPENQPVPTQNPRTTSDQFNELASPSTSTTSDGTTTRIPPRDPGNRIVYIIPNNCDCPFTTQYTPVCGTDGQTYGNIGILTCNKMCGINVDVYLVGACGRNNG